ncbi:very-long-chain aldehyde decarbonylase CER1-like [Ziziphus jujuba]|uniref:Very-long-chain aldehyde decarbonylase CER1-like n=1 Tax=Ziziphus jujuba TaxID=326968 RepID=A0ABM4A8K5_ZIZJJ|nr:very-long-chain aldehyde decarbonylase CER1-like [Ziziphus jujuba]
MASKPEILSDWPWKPLGSFKYVILAPWMVHSAYLCINIMKGSERELHLVYLLVLPLALIRMLHNQIWISLSRYRTAKGKTRILHRPLEFHQVDRESNWGDQILFASILFYIGYKIIPWGAIQPVRRTDGVVITALLYVGPVEFVYYWFHRALHHHFLYSRYHSHHHSSIVTEPIS